MTDLEQFLCFDLSLFLGDQRSPHSLDSALPPIIEWVLGQLIIPLLLNLLCDVLLDS